MNLSYRVLTGPTAAGKTACLLQRARERALALISADSRQVCLGMDTGTGKPTSADFKILPHYLLDLVEPPISFSVYQFIIEAAKVLQELEEAQREIWVCGGTGLYIRALIMDLPLKAGPRPILRGALEEMIKRTPAHEVATRLGLRLAEEHNPARVIRACETACENAEECQRLYILAGLNAKDAEADAPTAEQDLGFASAREYLRRWTCLGVAVLDPGVGKLQPLIAQRVRAMFMEGLLDEVARLRDQGHGEAPVVRDGIAYREALAVLDGRLDVEAAIELAVIRTRQYAKRQRTYFRGQGWPVYATCRECLTALGVD
jgi:tRNA dimethylallyltransferase